MVTIRVNESIKEGYAMPSLGSLMGSSVSSAVFDSINSNGHSALFDKRFDNLHQSFFDIHIKPMEELSAALQGTFTAIMNPDIFRPLMTIEDFRSIPLCMELSILTFPPVRKLLEEGRIDGFGYDPRTLPDEDLYGRLIDNGYVENVETASDEDGNFTVEYVQHSTDPDLSDDDILYIRRTRETIMNYILEETDRDPTSIDDMRG